MYTYREDSVKLIEGLKKYDEKHQRFSFVSDVADLTALVATTTTEPQQATAGKERRPSIAAQANDLMWLSNKLDKFEPLMWWASGYLIAMRIIQTSMMVFITNPSLQASVASLIALVGVCAQRNATPYRRPSDNDAALVAGWLVFVWCSFLLVRYSGAFDDRHGPVLGGVLIVVTVVMLGEMLRSLVVDVHKANGMKPFEASRDVEVDSPEDEAQQAAEAEESELCVEAANAGGAVTADGESSPCAPSTPNSSWGMGLLEMCGAAEETGSDDTTAEALVEKLRGELAGKNAEIAKLRDENSTRE